MISLNQYKTPLNHHFSLETDRSWLVAHWTNSRLLNPPGPLISPVGREKTRVAAVLQRQSKVLRKGLWMTKIWRTNDVLYILIILTYIYIYIIIIYIVYYIIFNYIQYIYTYIYIYTLYIILAGDIDDFNSSCDLVWIMFTKYTAHPANLHSDPCHGLWASHGSQLILTYGGTKAHSKAYIGHTHVYIIYSLYIYLYIFI